MSAGDKGSAQSTGGASTPPVVSPSTSSLRWLISLRLVVISALFFGVLIIQVYTQLILQLRDFYILILLTYGLSLVYIVLFLRGVASRIQAVVQLLGDIAIVTGFVYATGGLYSPFSFLYLMVIVMAAVLLRGGGLIFAGISAVVYGVLVDLMVFEVLPIPPNIVGARVALPTARVLYQLMIHIVGFVLVAVLVSYLGESLRRAHHRLQEEQERSSRLAALTDHVVRSVGAGIIAADLDGMVLHLNPAGSRILGLDDPDLIAGRPLFEVMPLHGLHWGLLQGRARTRSVVRLEGDHEQTGRRLGLTIGPLEDEHETVVGFIVNFQDLSEVAVENERRRLQERMAAVGEMAARMAHEIKNPLASISGSAQVLASSSGVDAANRRLLEIVVDESRRLSGILDSFLHYARPQGATRQPCDVASLLRDCIDLQRRSAEMKDHHEITLSAPDELRVRGDEHLLRQVFWNLSRNALQALPNGGHVHVTARGEGDKVVVRWRDDGVGMPEDVSKRAFEPFVTTQPGGTGLGLAIVYAAVEEHGGSVEIDSTPGRGTTVTIELPTSGEES